MMAKAALIQPYKNLLDSLLEEDMSLQPFFLCDSSKLINTDFFEHLDTDSIGLNLRFESSPYSNEMARVLDSILPLLKSKGYQYLVIEGLAVDSIIPTQNFIIKDSLGIIFYQSVNNHLLKHAIQLGIKCYSESFFDFDRYSSNKNKQKWMFLSFQKFHYSDASNCFELGESPILSDTVLQNTLTFHVCEEQFMSMKEINLSSMNMVNWNDISSKAINDIDYYLYPIFVGKNTPNFTMPINRFIEFPAILAVYDRNSFENGGIPFETREIFTKDANTSFYLSKGDYTFLFLYKNREMRHSLHVIITK